jgi:hypothetical protein
VIAAAIPDAMLLPTDDCFAQEVPEHARAITAYLQSEAVISVPWPAMSPDLNPIEHIWDMLGRRIQTREPHVQNIRLDDSISPASHPSS